MTVDRAALREKLLERAEAAITPMAQTDGQQYEPTENDMLAAKHAVEAALMLEPRPGDFAGKLVRLAESVVVATGMEARALPAGDVLDLAAHELEDLAGVRAAMASVRDAFLLLRGVMDRLARQAADSETPQGSRRAEDLRASIAYADSIADGAKG
jgi:hypothetical protein